MFLVPDGAEVLLLSQHVYRTINIFVIFVVQFLFLIPILDPDRLFITFKYFTFYISAYVAARTHCCTLHYYSCRLIILLCSIHLPPATEDSSNSQDASRSATFHISSRPLIFISGDYFTKKGHKRSIRLRTNSLPSKHPQHVYFSSSQISVLLATFA